MRILHVTPFLWSGAGQVITSLCESQATEGHQVWITTSAPSGGQTDWPAYRRRLTNAGVSRVRIDTFDRSPATYWNCVDRLVALVDQIRPDIVHSHAGVPACATADARRRCAHRFGFVSHVYSWGENRPRWMNTMDTSGHAQGDVVICSATAYVDILVRAGVPAKRIVMLPWGLAPSTLSRTRRDDNLSVPLGPRLGFVGRIEPRKGQLALVRALALARRTHPNATLELVGPIADPGYAEQIRREINRLHLKGVVRLAGRVRDVPAVLRRWDGFVSLSSDEGQGLAILEAMAAEVPVAARMVAGVEDYFLPGRNGVDIASTRPRDVAAAIDALTDRRRSRARVQRALALTESRYSWARTVAALNRIYTRVRPRR